MTGTKCYSTGRWEMVCGRWRLRYGRSCPVGYLWEKFELFGDLGDGRGRKTENTKNFRLELPRPEHSVQSCLVLCKLGNAELGNAELGNAELGNADYGNWKLQITLYCICINIV